MNRFIVTNAQHAREAHGDAALVARAFVDAFQAELEDKRRFHATHGAEFVDRRFASKYGLRVWR